MKMLYLALFCLSLGPLKPFLWLLVSFLGHQESCIGPGSWSLRVFTWPLIVMSWTLDLLVLVFESLFLTIKNISWTLVLVSLFFAISSYVLDLILSLGLSKSLVCLLDYFFLAKKIEIRRHVLDLSFIFVSFGLGLAFKRLGFVFQSIFLVIKSHVLDICLSLWVFSGQLGLVLTL